MRSNFADLIRTRRSGLRHEALFYESPDALLAATVPFVEAGIEAGESVLVLVPSTSRALLERAIDGVAADRVRFAAMEEVGRNPARLISVWKDFLDAGVAEGRGVRGVGEPLWAGRSQAEVEECDRHELLLGPAFADEMAWTLLCPYDVAGLSTDVLERARSWHPVVSRRGESSANETYRGPVAAVDVFAGELPEAPVEAAELAFGPAELREARRIVGAGAEVAALGRDRTENLVLAANEIATNSIKHGGGRGLLRVWPEDGAVLCEVRDAGVFTDPLVGRRRPSLDQVDGRGIWIANQVCDLVQIRSDENGSVVRLTMAS